jgi:hypothetical protein
MKNKLPVKRFQIPFIKNLVTAICSMLLLIPTFSQKKPLRRADSFFGLHFDFHATADDTLVGKTLTAGMIDTLLVAAKPDFIQVDCKGHPGIASYPTKVLNGTHAKSFEKNTLDLFRKVTKKHGVALYVHYSGVWDQAALQKHPDWASMDSTGKLNPLITSVHGPYADELMIPQLKEIADYGVDGVWVDGDSWATEVDYSPKAIEKFKSETGITTIPKNQKDANYESFMAFNRTSFKNYVAHYTDVLHQYKPGFQIASNWAFSSFMPEPVTLNIDFMSGDLTPMNGVTSALFESRLLASQSKMYKKPWDLMSWGFNTAWQTDHVGSKTALNLSQEAAEVIATGGSYQCYFMQNRDASIKMQQVRTMSEISKFVRQRQPFTQGANAIPQIGLLYSLASFNKFSTRIYNNSIADASKGILTALLDGQNAVEVLTEYHLKGNLSKYPLIIIPEWIYLEEDFINDLKKYTQNGGNLLIIGAEAVKNFSSELQIDFNGPSKKESFWISAEKNPGYVNDSLQKVSLRNNIQILGNYFYQEDLRFPKGISASMTNYGKGKIAGVYFNFGLSYRNFQSPDLRDFLNSIVKKVFNNPIVEVRGSTLIHVTVNDLKGKLAINLINSGGNYKAINVYTYDEVPPLNDVEISVRFPQKPVKIIQQPEHKLLNFTYSNGTAIFKVPQLKLHSIILVE